MAKRLTEDDCKRLYAECGTPENVIAHCRAVGDTAYEIAHSLNEAGCDYDEDLVRMSGYVHDLMRVYENHGERGADVLEEQGYFDEADIVREHMYHCFHTIENLDETDIVCLADRMVKDDKYVGIEERMSDLIIRRKVPDFMIAYINEKKEETAEFIREIEKISGKTMDELFNKN